MKTRCTLAAAAWVVLAVLFLAQPAAFSPGISFPMELGTEGIARFWSARPDTSAVHVGLHLAAVITAVLTLGVVVSLQQRLGAVAAWASALGALGLATTAISNARYLAMEPTYAQLFLEATPEARHAVAVASASLALDPWGVLEFGLLAVWIVGVTRALPGGASLALRATAGVAAVGFAGMVAGAWGWPRALEVAPLLGTPGLVAWLILLPAALSGRDRQSD